MIDDVSAWALQIAAEQLGYEDFSEVPSQSMGEVYEIAEEIDY